MDAQLPHFLTFYIVLLESKYKKKILQNISFLLLLLFMNQLIWKYRKKLVEGFFFSFFSYSSQLTVSVSYLYTPRNIFLLYRYTHAHIVNLFRARRTFSLYSFLTLQLTLEENLFHAVNIVVYLLCNPNMIKLRKLRIILEKIQTLILLLFVFYRSNVKFKLN